MKTTFSALVTLLVTATALSAQDPNWVRMWNEAQKLKPARISSIERIAPTTEPGIPLVVQGVITDPAGKPAAGVEVFAYHTDSTGLYSQPHAADPWRLKGWTVTDAQGRFEFRTIRPAPYPGRDIPAHIHLSFVTSCCGRQWSEVMFDDDALGTKEYRQRNPDVLWGKVAKNAYGSQETNYAFKLKSRGDF
ncbi:MAG TPA: hypothetical protein VEL51_04995 [Vicinamibacterales bacterium]|nr:hypothetical protein [Vicinamibacterales bacterium]